MPLDQFLNAPRQISELLSRRSMLHAGLLPLLALRGSASERILAGHPRSALALPLEGSEAGRLGLAISPDGSTAYVAFKTPDVVLVVDLRAGRVRSAIDLTPAGVMVASSQAVLSADGKLLFVANQGVENVAVIDTATERVVKVLPFCPGYGDAIKAIPGGKVYIGLLDGRLITVSCADLSYKTINFEATIVSIALSAQRANLLYAVSAENFHLGPTKGQHYFHAFNLDTGGEERQQSLPPGVGSPSGGVTRMLLASSGDVAYLGWNELRNYGGFGGITVFDLKTFRAGASTAIEDGVTDFAVHPETGRIHAVGEWTGSRQGRVDNTLYIVEWDPTSQKVTRRIPVVPASRMSSILFDPLNPRFVYATENGLGMIRKVDMLTGTELMRVRFSAAKRLPSSAATSGSLAYITCARSPLIHKMDLNSGRITGTLDLPGMSGSGQCGYFDGKLYIGSYTRITVINAADGSPIFSRQMPDGLGLHSMTFFRDKIAAAAGPAGGDLDRILILDARTLEVLNTFRLEMPVLGRRGCPVASPDGSKLYVQQAIYAEKVLLQVLDSATLRVRTSIYPPTAAFWGGDGEVGDFDEQKRIAYLGGASSVYKVHMDSDEFLGMLNIPDAYKAMGRTGGWPAVGLAGVHLTAAKDRLLITTWAAHSVFQYDLRNEKWIPRVIRVGLRPAATVISADRRYLYTLNEGSDNIARLDTAAGELLDVTPVGGPVSQLNIGSLLHGASFHGVPVVPGCVMVFREGGIPGEIGPPFLTSLRLDASGRVATELADTKVLFDGVPAPILYAYAAQVGFVVPYSVAGKRTVKVQLIYKGEETYPIEFNVADAYPGIFTMDSSGKGQAAMLNQDGTLNGPANPAAKGSVVVFYATGGGQTDPPGVDGELTKDVLSRPRLPVGVWIQGQEAEVLYAGAAPGIVSGVMQVNIKLPMNIPSENGVTVVMKLGNWPPNPDGVTMAVR